MHMYVYIHTGILLSHKKDEICSKVEGLGGYYAM